ncbi:MAG: LysM peptidoglycan-binding domain-containing protein [Caldilineaceae bacterium]
MIVVGFTLALPALPPPTLTAVPSATPCGPPSDWGIYLVQPGDTLYALAQQTGVTVAAIQNANCLPDLEIFEGRGLYLPFQPSGVAVGRATGSGGSRESATPAAGGEATPPVCPSEFVCITATELDTPRPLSLGQPNDSGSLCYDAQGNPIVTDQPTIQVGYRSRRLPQIEGTLQEAITRGEWLLMAACNFPDPTTVTIEMYHDAEAIPLVTQRTMVGDRQIVTAAWPALCTVSTAGTYQLTARDGTGVHDSLTFQVDISDPQILAVPYNGAPGAFEIYFCDYASEAGDTINIDLFSHPVRDELNQITYTRRRTDKVFIPLTGWSKVTLILPIKNEESASYLITDDVNDEEKIDIYAE